MSGKSHLKGKPSSGAEKITRRTTQTAGQGEDGFHADIALTAFDAADVVPVQA